MSPDKYSLRRTARLLEEEAPSRTFARPEDRQKADTVPQCSGRPRRLAYLTTSYPSVSHTFIRREILGLEALGYEVARFALRPGNAIVDQSDRAELRKTQYLLDQPPMDIVRNVLAGALVAGRRIVVGFAETFSFSRRSERGILRHLAYLLEALMLIALCRRKGVDHVHVHFGTNAATVAFLASRMTEVTFSMTVHGPDEFDAAIGFSLGRKIAASMFTVAVSSFGASQLRRWVPHEHWQKIRVVHCSVGDEWFTAATPVAGQSENLVCVGRLSEQKGQLLLIEAFAAAVKKGLRQNLVLVGDGDLRPIIEQHIAGHGLQQRVTITGWCDETQVRRHLVEARALILSSFAEGLPVVIMEAMALGRPVLSTTIMGIPELVIDGENGWLVPAGDADAFAQALLEIGHAPIDSLREMGANGRRRVRERHSTDTEVAKLDGLLSAFVMAAN